MQLVASFQPSSTLRHPRSSVVIFVHGLYGLGQSVFEAFFAAPWWKEVGSPWESPHQLSHPTTGVGLHEQLLEHVCLNLFLTYVYEMCNILQHWLFDWYKKLVTVGLTCGNCMDVWQGALVAGVLRLSPTPEIE